ncbi:hypothetical protein FISHEDRAFT_47375 [Fistulina hepatica ATCC 64428]|uniref:Uncharacterized protein n=1 Tax=Fistulina hepatica ATCC 64428 TaxID=1128425 RepID=A0A0D7A5W0_9AGAR|nr:hypothetical protein FISHEDRAFT_47375 [Fistulina hepatica ATCC 64428]
MDSTTTAERGAHTTAKSACDIDDWEDLKDLFQKATEQYEQDDDAEAAPLLRGVIHECHRFLLHYHDPSVLFLAPYPPSPDDDEGLPFWSPFHGPAPIGPPQEQKPKCKCRELPTAFHSILGSTLFLFGNLVSRAPDLVLPGEPSEPLPYWLAALDVFETGENLPWRTSSSLVDTDAPEDWRMALAWGRTLVCIADEALAGSRAFAPEPRWSPSSPFATIAARRPPVTQRMTLSSASPHDLLILAMDQFSRGIFHMPHPAHAMSIPPSATAVANAGGNNALQRLHPMPAPFSRAKELYTLAYEVLLVAEKLSAPRERQYWAAWADSVLNQMKMEADMASWRVRIARGRGRCWLAVGNARVDDMEVRWEGPGDFGALVEAGDPTLLESTAARDARTALRTAVDYFERALALGSREEGEDHVVDGTEADGTARTGAYNEELAEIRSMLAEALMMLGNLIMNTAERERMYARAIEEGGDEVRQLLELDSDDHMDTS